MSESYRCEKCGNPTEYQKDGTELCRLCNARWVRLKRRPLPPGVSLEDSVKAATDKAIYGTTKN